MKRICQYIAFLCIFTLLVTSISSCSYFETNNSVAQDKTPEDQEGEQVTAIYDALLEEIEKYSMEFHFSNIDEAELCAAYKEVLADHPEIFWLSNSYSYRTETKGDQTDITFIPVTMKMDFVPEMKKELDAVVNRVVSNAKGLSSAFDKIVYIHDYIIENTQYDNDAYQLVSSGQADDSIMDSATVYGCLVKGQAICSGYSAAFQYLAQKLGFACGRVRGEKEDGESHEWNYILLDDEYYYIDVTWDDPVSSDGSSNEKTYEFFCVTTDELLQTHVIDEDQSVPQCNGTKYDYYIYNGLYVEEYSFEKVAAIIDQHRGGDFIEIKFSSESECQKAQKDLIEDGHIFDVNEEIRERGKLSYSVGINGLVLSIFY